MIRHMPTSRRLVQLLLALALSAGPAAAVQRVWLPTSTSDWSVAANWSGTLVPQPGDDVVITNSGTKVLLSSSSAALGSLSISNGATLIFTNWATLLTATNITVGDQGTVTCEGPFKDDPGLSNRVYIACSDLTIAAGGDIDVFQRGFKGGEDRFTPGYGPSGGANSYYDASGAGHGGRGGNSGGNPGDEAAAPAWPGSGGGGNVFTVGGHGGGAVRIDATGTVTVDGTINANAETTVSREGGGAGGSVYITCAALEGAGLVTARGSDSTSTLYPGSGAGGRIAVINVPAAQSNAAPVAVEFNAAAGTTRSDKTAYRGDMGSVYLPDTALLGAGLGNIQGRLEAVPPFTAAGFTADGRSIGFADGITATITGDVVVGGALGRLDIGGSSYGSYGAIYYRVNETSAPVVSVQGDLVLSNSAQAYVYGSVTNTPPPDYGALVDVDGELRVDEGASLWVHSHPTNGGSPKFELGKLTVRTNGQLNANSRGYARGDGSGVPGRWGYGPGAGYSEGGAGYGGAGYPKSGSGGATYGSSNAPVHAGSGGGSANTISYGRGAPGAGAIRLYVSDTTTLDAGALLTANGGNGPQSPVVSDRKGGGGAGGTVYLRTRILIGDQGASLSANGGHGGVGNGGGGGGGRIAILRMFDYSPTPLATSVIGGNGSLNTVLTPSHYGGTGTVYWVFLPPDTCDIHNRPASNVTSTAAFLNAYLFATGTSDTVVSVYWGDEDGGDPTSGVWDTTNTWAANTWASGDYPYTNVTLPATDTFYYYRYYATNSAGDDWPTNTEYFLGGNIWVTAPDPAATEQWLTAGTYTVHRAAGATNEDTIVYFSTAGTAIEHTDYVLSPSNMLTIPAGEASASIILTPLGDADGAEGPETAWLVLEPGLYGIGTPASNLVTIQDFPIVPGTNMSLRDGDWMVPTNWSIGRRPEAGDSVYVKHAMSLSTSTPALASCTVSNTTLTLADWATILSATNVLVTSNGTITCSGPFRNGDMSNRVHIVCEAITIDIGSAIDVSGKGFRGGDEGNGKGHGPGGGGGTTYDGSGAGHGGRGGGNSPGVPYDDPSAPLLPGSGGGDGQHPATHGGGAVRLDVSGRVTLNGSILADGLSSTGRAGHGSGGSIYVTCNAIAANNAVVSAHGGSTTSTLWPGTGAGGRIALVVDRVAQSNEVGPTITFDAASGDIPNQAYRGEMGTVRLNEPDLIASDMSNIEGMLYDLPPFTKASLSLNDRWVGFADSIVATISGDVLVEGPKARIDVGGSDYRYVSSLYYRLGVTSPPVVSVRGDLTFTNGAVMSVYSSPTNATWPEYGALLEVNGLLALMADATVSVRCEPENGGAPEFRVGQLLMQTNALISANEGGYPRSTGSDRWGFGPGKGYYRGGAGHGGAGYAYDGSGGATYGSSNAPVEPGSGGGSAGAQSYTRGGNGGGAIRIHATSSVMMESGATLTTDGGRGSWDSTNADRNGGGGAGGSIYVTCNGFRGEAGVTLSADGGDAARYAGGGGGGGRIAVWRKYDGSPGSATATVAGGGGRAVADWVPAYDGEDGTIVWGWIPIPGTIIMLR